MHLIVVGFVVVLATGANAAALAEEKMAMVAAAAHEWPPAAIAQTISGVATAQDTSTGRSILRGATAVVNKNRVAIDSQVTIANAQLRSSQNDVIHVMDHSSVVVNGAGDQTSDEDGSSSE